MLPDRTSDLPNRFTDSVEKGSAPVFREMPTVSDLIGVRQSLGDRLTVPNPKGRHSPVRAFARMLTDALALNQAGKSAATNSLILTPSNVMESWAV